MRTGQPRAISFLDGEIDPAEAFILRELGMNALLMLPLHVRGRPWGLLELYEMRLRRFTEDDLAVARFLVAQAERRLGLVADHEPPRHAKVYELPPGSPRGPLREVGAPPSVAGKGGRADPRDGVLLPVEHHTLSRRRRLLELEQAVAGARHEREERRCGRSGHACVEDRRLALLELRFPLVERTLPELDGRPPELDGADLPAAAFELGFVRFDPRLALVELLQALLKLRLAGVEVVGAEPEQPFERCSGVAQELLAPLDVCRDLLDADDVLLQLTTSCLEQARKPLFVCPRGAQAHPSWLSQAAVVPASRSSAVDSGQPAGFTEFVAAVSCPSAQEDHPKRVKRAAVEADNSRIWILSAHDCSQPASRRVSPWERGSSSSPTRTTSPGSARAIAASSTTSTPTAPCASSGIAASSPGSIPTARLSARWLPSCRGPGMPGRYH